MRDVSIVIPSWNGRRLLEQFLPSVADAAGAYARGASAAVQIVVVDDGSTDGTMDWLAGRQPESPVPVMPVRLDVNRGFGEACNHGVRAASHPLVLLLNNDIELAAGAIAPLAAPFAAARERSRLFAVHGRMFDFESGAEVGTGKMGGFTRGFLRVHRSYVTRGPATGPLYSMFATGGCSIVDRELFLELGGFDPLFAPFYLEDVELSYRAWKRGLSVEYAPDSTARHRFSSTIGPLAGNRVARIGLRNRLILHWIHLHDRRMLVSHLCWAGLLALAGPLTLRPRLTISLFDALGRLSAIRQRRREERARAVRSDREVLAVFDALSRRSDVRAYDDPRELEA